MQHNHFRLFSRNRPTVSEVPFSTSSSAIIPRGFWITYMLTGLRRYCSLILICPSLMQNYIEYFLETFLVLCILLKAKGCLKRTGCLACEFCHRSILQIFFPFCWLCLHSSVYAPSCAHCSGLAITPFV